MTFLLFVGKREVHVFDINNNYKRIYINGKKSFDYEITKAEIYFGTLLSFLKEEYSLSSEAEVQFIILTNPEKGINDIVQRLLKKHIVSKYNVDEIMSNTIKILSNNKESMVDLYGINFDGNCYKLVNNKLFIGEFSLLAYTLNDELLLDAIRFGASVNRR